MTDEREKVIRRRDANAYHSDWRDKLSQPVVDRHDLLTKLDEARAQIEYLTHSDHMNDAVLAGLEIDRLTAENERLKARVAELEQEAKT